jgi:hypothetical protein
VAGPSARVSDTVRLLGLNLGFTFVGAAACLIAGIPRERRWLPTVVGLAPIVGIAGCGLLASLGAMIGIDVSAPSMGVLAVVALLTGFLGARHWATARWTLAPPSPGKVGQTLELACLAMLVLLSVRIVALASATGLDGWDGWAMWGPKAHALFVEGDVWGPVFTESPYLMQHQEYPVLFPAIEALSAGAIDRFDPRLIDIEAAVVLVAFGWGAWAILRTVVPPAVAAAAALGLTASAPLITNATINYADSVVAAFTALGVLCLLVWLRSGSSAPALVAALLLAAAASTKAEGLLFAVAAVVAAVVSARGFDRRIRSAVALGLGVLVVPLVWTVVDRLNGPGAKNIDGALLTNPGAAVDAADRIPTAADRLMSVILDGWPLASVGALVAVAAACVARLWWSALFVVLWGALAFAALVGVYFASTAPIEWYLNLSADRVVFSIVLGLATVAPLLAAQAWERAVENPRRKGDAH